jgi:hypothetical protein
MEKKVDRDGRGRNAGKEEVKEIRKRINDVAVDYKIPALQGIKGRVGNGGKHKRGK